MTHAHRWRVLASLVVTVLGAAAALSSPLNASASSVTRIPFTGFFYGCSVIPGDVSVSADKILHFRNARNHNLWVTTTPYLNGFEDNVVDANINLETGFGDAHPHETLKPFAYNGTWETTVQLKISPDSVQAEAVGHGTGELTGMTVRWTQTGSFVPGPGENPCGDIPFAATFAGEILIPASMN